LSWESLLGVDTNKLGALLVWGWFFMVWLWMVCSAYLQSPENQFPVGYIVVFGGTELSIKAALTT